MATGQYFTITDGTTSALFADGADPPGDTNYEIRSAEWAPSIGGLQTSQLASAGPFVDVVEDIPINIKGSTVAAALLNLQTLQQLFDQAERWYLRRDNATIVEVRYSPKGATVSTSTEPLRSPIFGRVLGDANCVQLPPNFTGPVLSNSKYIVGARMRFVRRGWWTLTTTQSVTSVSQTNGDLHTLAFGAANKFLSVTKLRVNGIAFGNNMPVGLLLVHEKATGIPIFAAENGAPVTDYTSVANITQKALNDNVLRFTPTVTTARESLTITGVSIETTARLFAVYANVRNNSATTGFRVRVKAAGTHASHPIISTPYQNFPGGYAGSLPSWASIGLLATPYSPNGISVEIIASAASGTFDIDSIVLFDLTNTGYAVEVRNDQMNSGDFTSTDFLVADPKLAGTEDKRPILTANIVAGSVVVQMPYDGNILLPTKATTIYARWLSTRGQTADRWRQVTTADVLMSGTMVADRYISYLVPE